MVDLPIKETGLGLAEATYRDVNPEIIFEGILIERKQDMTKRIRDYRMLFEVTDVYNGECVDTIEVWTNHTGGGCGLQAGVYRRGERIGTWLYLNKRDEGDRLDFLQF